MREARGYLGLELAGAKNQKTAMAALEFYPKEKKIFLVDIYEKIAGKKNQTGDEALLELIDELRPGVARMGVNVALQLPPCICCSKKGCDLPSRCAIPAVKWMREATKKAARASSKPHRITDFTPYTQRPVELFVRYQVLPHLPENNRFDIDETLGGNRAPLNARMHFLKRHMGGLELAEVWPKLSVAVLATQLDLHKRTITRYRQLEEGVHAREEFLEALAERHGIFIYERDIRKLSHSLAAFDAFICAYTALLSDNQRTAKPPAGFPLASGWVHYPQLEC